MSETEKIAEIAAEGVSDGLHIVDEADLAMEKLSQGFDKVRLAYLGLGLAIGGAVGAVIAFKRAYVQAELKFSEIAAEEIAEMRQHYLDKATAVDLTMSKGSLDDLVKERGYSSENEKPPMAITPPKAVVEAAAEAAEEDANTDKIVKKATPEPEVRNIFRDTEVVEVDDAWDWHEERRKRSPLRPYIIHIDEREEQHSYDSVTYTYYEADDVLCNERDDVIAVEDRDKLIGEAHLNKFGHGSNSDSVVYIRNDQLEIDFEVVLSPNSYAEEVHGFDPPEIRHSSRRRSFDDD